MIQQALILAGGRGTRLGALTDRAPKPMMQIGGKPFLEYLLHNLKRHGIDRIVLSVGYLGNQISDYFGDGRDRGLAIDYVFEESPAGTGGAVKLAEPVLEPSFFVLNGDTFFDIDFHRLASSVNSDLCSAALALREVPDVSRYGSIRVDGPRVTGFLEKSTSGPGLINGGIYACQKSLLNRIPAPPCSLEKDLFPAVCAEGRLGGVAFSELFIDIGLPATLEQSQTLLPEWMAHARKVPEAAS